MKYPFSPGYALSGIDRSVPCFSGADDRRIALPGLRRTLRRNVRPLNHSPLGNESPPRNEVRAMTPKTLSKQTTAGKPSNTPHEALKVTVDLKVSFQTTIAPLPCLRRPSWHHRTPSWSCPYRTGRCRDRRNPQPCCV